MKGKSILFLWFVVIMGVVYVTGCQTSPSTPSPKTDGEKILGKWVLESTQAPLSNTASWELYRMSFSNEEAEQGATISNFSWTMEQTFNYESSTLVSITEKQTFSYIRMKATTTNTVTSNVQLTLPYRYSLDPNAKLITFVLEFASPPYTNVMQYSFISDTKMMLSFTNNCPWLAFGLTNFIYRKE